ncbi:MAG: hypothetical protein ACPGSB_00040 [Opitutales bacterium]
MKYAPHILLAAIVLFLCSCVTSPSRLTTKEYQLKFDYMIELNPVGSVAGANRKEREKPEKWSHLSDADFSTICWLERQGIEFEGVEGAWLVHHDKPATADEIKVMLPNYGYIEVRNTKENHQRIYEWIQSKEGHPVVPATPRSYEGISLPLLAGLEPDELEAVLSDWREEMSGK